MHKLSRLALAVAGSFFAMPLVFAAEEVAKEEQKIEKIEVTGSRIKGVDLDGTQPLVVISADDIKTLVPARFMTYLKMLVSYVVVQARFLPLKAVQLQHLPLRARQQRHCAGWDHPLR